MKILIVGASWVGDMVMSQSLFKVLKAQYPESELTVLAPEWTRPILERMPEVFSTVSMPVGHGSLMLKERYQLGKQLRAQQFDQAILLPNSLKSALIPFFASIPKRTGWLGEVRYGLLNDWRKLDKKKHPLMVQRFNALALGQNAACPTEWPTPALEIDVLNQANLREVFQLTSVRPVLILCPGAEFGIAKKWPEAHYAQVGQHYIKAGWQVWLLGSKNDETTTATIKHALDHEIQQYCVDLAGKTQLVDAVDLIGMGHAVVTNDSGLMHVAAALRKPLVVVYGSTSPKFTPPLADAVRSVSTGIECSPCFKRVCEFDHYKCLKELPAKQVLDALGELLA